MWFENLVGFPEENPEQVKENLSVEGEYLVSKINGKKIKFGRLEIPTLGELKSSISILEESENSISVSEIVGNVQELHEKLENQGSIFQAASQFNLLEMVGPHVTPESGVGIYERDYTQGPACAIACGAGTIYRNYFVALENQIGQSSELQVDCLEEIGKSFRNDELQIWEMKNGYALANKEGLMNISEHIKGLNKIEYERLKAKLKVGIQWNTEVTLNVNKQLVSQVYCSALPVAYSNIESRYWEPFAKLILEATYEATFYAAYKNYLSTGNKKLFLTLVGGGAFGNEPEWIFDAMEHSINKFRKTPLDVAIVSYGRSNWEVKDFVDRMN